mgnify:CR=1 FL=1
MSTTNTTIEILRDIAACYERAANALEYAALLASTLAPDPDRAARAEVERAATALQRIAHAVGLNMYADDSFTLMMAADTIAERVESHLRHASAPTSTTTDDANTIERAYVEAIEALGWDPDKLNTRDARDCIYALRTLEDLDYAEALEKRRAEMRPARKVRESVLDAITVRRDVLADPARAPRKAAP